MIKRKQMIRNLANRRLDALNQTDNVYMNVEVFFENIVYIGTNQSKSEYFNNSQYFIFRYYDLDEVEFSFKIDVKQIRINREEKQVSKFYANMSKSSEIMLSFYKYEEIKQSIFITFEDLIDLLEQKIKIEDLEEVHKEINNK